ncbi:hypothetical protein AAFF_G00277940 [Aldrovandia affinis]|uniref:Uncharacterized protein n=1 Tax=Aldrovandia affinis TaxID=143900 RepID=A0AAD7W223_9TELE|nr:hypothetical protein AAFF_G00277940 [Aldrovandia affinis]
MNIASKAGIVMALSQRLLEFVSEDKIDMTKLRDQKTNKAQSKGVGKQFKRIAASLKKEKECEVKNPALSLCEEGKNICDLLKKELANRSRVESCHQEDIAAAIRDLVEKVGSNQFVKARLELQKGCQEAQKGILELVQRNREEFDEKIDKRIDSINHNLKSVLPTPSREEQKAIEDTVHKAPQEILKEITAEDADQFC